MEYVYSFGKTHRIDRTIGIAAITLFHFDARSPTKTFECFRHGRVALACLCKKQCVAHLTLYGRRKSHVIGLRSPAPDQRPWLASLKSHSVICDISHNPSSPSPFFHHPRHVDDFESSLHPHCHASRDCTLKAIDRL